MRDAQRPRRREFREALRGYADAHFGQYTVTGTSTFQMQCTPRAVTEGRLEDRDQSMAIDLSAAMGHHEIGKDAGVDFFL